MKDSTVLKSGNELLHWNVARVRFYAYNVYVFGVHHGMLPVSYKKDFEFSHHIGASNQIGVCFVMRGSFNFHNFAVRASERADYLVEYFIPGLCVEKVFDIVRPTYRTRVIRVYHHVTAALYALHPRDKTHDIQNLRTKKFRI